MERDHDDEGRPAPGGEQDRGEGWTQAKSTRAVPERDPESFAEYPADEPASRTAAELSGAPVEPERAGRPAKAGSDAGKAG